MLKKTALLPLILLMALAAPLSAQEETATDDAAAAGETATVEDQLSMGQEVGEGELGQLYSAEMVGDWEMRCIKTEQEEDPCQMYQLLKDENGNAVAEYSLFRLKDGGQAVAGAMVTVPLETLLTAQLLITVDGTKARRYPYSFCNPVGCIARVGLTAGDVAAYKAGAKAEIVLVPAVAPDQKVTLNLSLKGFTAGYDKVSVVEN